MTENLRKAIETQINKELWSAYLYLDIARFYASKDLPGLHSWFKKQAEEEVEHAEKFANFLHEIGLDYKLLPVEAPHQEFKDLREPLIFQLEHEKLVTSLIHNLMKIAKEENDYAAENFLGWYVKEQIEEEANAAEAIAKYDYCMGGQHGILNFDAKMGER